MFLPEATFSFRHAWPVGAPVCFAVLLVIVIEQLITSPPAWVRRVPQWLVMIVGVAGSLGITLFLLWALSRVVGS